MAPNWKGELDEDTQKHVFVFYISVWVDCVDNKKRKIKFSELRKLANDDRKEAIVDSLYEKIRTYVENWKNGQYEIITDGSDAFTAFSPWEYMTPIATKKFQVKNNEFRVVFEY